MRTLLWFIPFLLAGCQLEQPVTPRQPAKSSDTIPDHAVLKLKLVKDSTSYDETMLIFNRKAPSVYNSNYDAVYLQGFGQISLACRSSDGHDLAIYTLPFTAGTPVALDVDSKTSGTFFLRLSFESKIPPDIQIWIIDALRKDSADVRNANYAFEVNKADTDSFGNKRFKLVLRQTRQRHKPLCRIYIL